MCHLYVHSFLCNFVQLCFAVVMCCCNVVLHDVGVHFSVFVEFCGLKLLSSVSCSVRCQAPNDMLRSGWEPLKICGDGNCLFRSMSVAITEDQSESLHQWLKLWAIFHGCINEHFYIKQVQYKYCRSSNSFVIWY